MIKLIFLVITIVLLPSSTEAMGWFGSPLDGKVVMKWENVTCPAGYTWDGEVKINDLWYKTPLAERGTCVAYEPGLDVEWRAYCTNGTNTKYFKTVDANKLSENCSAIKSIDNVLYPQEDVDKWNETHVE